MFLLRIEGQYENLSNQPVVQRERFDDGLIGVLFLIIKKAREVKFFYFNIYNLRINYDYDINTAPVNQYKNKLRLRKKLEEF